MKTLAAALLLIATNAHAQLSALAYTDSKWFSGCCTAASVGSYVAAYRPDYAWTLALLPGRDTADTADLATLLAANDYDLVVIDLSTNDPLNLGVTTTPASTLTRLSALCDMAQADGADCVISTPMHAPATRGQALDYEQWTEEVAALIRASGEMYVDPRAAMDVSTWVADCADIYRVHPNNDACRRILAAEIAGTLP